MATANANLKNLASSSGFVTLMCFQAVLLLVLFSGFAASGTVVTNLPGFEGELPFYLETGYIGVGDSNASQLFYYFVESQRSPALDPLMLWLTGGPGCSVASAFFYEQGPVTFNYTAYAGGLPSLILSPTTWTKGLNILYLDAPVGTGFSYSLTQENYYIDDIRSANQTYEFLQKWLIEHPQYLTNQLFIGGDSYSGIPLPIVVKNIVDGNQADAYPHLNLQGYILGNPKTDDYIDVNSNVPFVHRLTLIPDELYRDAKSSCGGDYVNVNENNTECVTDLDLVDELTLEINLMNILEPICQTALPRRKGQRREFEGRRSLQEHIDNISPSHLLNSTFWCRDYHYVLSGIWANDKAVRDALNIREGTVKVWKRCNSSLAYTKTVSSSVPYHKSLTSESLRVLVYSGDHDMSVPTIGTQNWIRVLNLTTDEYWRAWYLNGQVAGYTVKYLSGDYTLTFATVKAAGHVAPEYKPEECYAMIDRFYATYPL